MSLTHDPERIGPLDFFLNDAFSHWEDSFPIDPSLPGGPVWPKRGPASTGERDALSAASRRFLKEKLQNMTKFTPSTDPKVFSVFLRYEQPDLDGFLNLFEWTNRTAADRWEGKRFVYTSIVPVVDAAGNLVYNYVGPSGENPYFGLDAQLGNPKFFHSV